MSVVAAFRAETLKLRKRPGVWILVGTMAGVVLLFGYVLLYVLATQAPADAVQGLDAAALLDGLRPASLAAQVLSMVAGFGGAIGLIVGALAFGAEYSWRTVATMATQRPRRLALMSGRVLAVGLTCLVLALAAFAGGALGTGLIAVLEPTDNAGPPIADLASAYGVAALTVGVWCAIGVCLATVFRSTAWAIGLGLLYALAIESVLGILPLAGDIGDLVARALISNNIAALVVAVAPQSTETFGGPAVTIDAGQAVTVLVAYAAAAYAIAAAAFVRRDIAA